MNRLASLLLLPALLAAAPWIGPFRVEPNQQNVVASRLVGTWEPDLALAERLGVSPADRIRFESDPEIAAKIPERYAKPLADRQIFLAGTMTRTTPAEAGPSIQRYPFILLTMEGNPHLVYFRERKGDPMGDAESFNLSVIPAKDTANDLLFIGGDSNNQPFAAFHRGAD